MKPAAITIIFNDQKDHILLIKRKDIPVFVLPGGGIEGFEDFEEAAIREAFEETGLHVEIVRKTGEYSPINKLASQTHVYEAKILHGSFTIGDETAEIDFFPIKSLPKNFFVIHQDFLNDALNNHEVVKKQLTQITYFNFLKYFLKHPILSILAIRARLKR